MLVGRQHLAHASSLGVLDLLAHAQHPVNLLDTKPVQDVRHKGLEAHVLHTGDVLGTLEVIRGAIGTPLSSVVDDCLTFSTACLMCT